jgi:hypothetical protein
MKRGTRFKNEGLGQAAYQPLLPREVDGQRPYEIL